MLRAVSIKRAGDLLSGPRSLDLFDVAVLAHDERHLRRRVLNLSRGEKVLVDFPEPVVLDDRDALVVEDGRVIGIVAAEEELCDVRGRDAVHLAELAWHIGNRHLAAAIGADRIVILRDHVIKAMLEGLGARVAEVREPFSPLGGAYSHQHEHSPHAHEHVHRHDHGHNAGQEHGRGVGHDHVDHRHRHDDNHAQHRRPASARHRHDG